MNSKNGINERFRIILKPVAKPLYNKLQNLLTYGYF